MPRSSRCLLSVQAAAHSARYPREHDFVTCHRPGIAGCTTGTQVLLLFKSFYSSYHWQGQRRFIQIYCQFRPRFRPECKFPIARKDHQSDLLTRFNNLIVWLEQKGNGVEFAGFQGFALPDRLVVLRVRPPPCNKVIRNDGTAPFIPGQGDEPDRQVCRRFTAGQFNSYLRYTRNMEVLFQLWRQIDKAVNM